MRVYVVRKWPLRERSRLVCYNITRGSLWSLCPRGPLTLCPVIFLCGNVKDRVFVPPLSRDLVNLKAWIIAAVKNIDPIMLTRVFSCGCEHSTKVGSLVFLLWIFIITKNVIKLPVFYRIIQAIFWQERLKSRTPAGFVVETSGIQCSNTSTELLLRAVSLTVSTTAPRGNNNLCLK
jgi:hypothetical protein